MNACTPLHTGRSSGANRLAARLPASLSEVDTLLSHLFPPTVFSREAASVAPTSLWEADGRLYVEVDAPGVTPEHVGVEFENGQLTVTLERSAGEPAPTYAYNERRFGKVTRSIALPDTVDPESLEASLTNGVLRVSVGKRAEAQPRRVEVKLG